jgi:hypothetical protein
LAVAEDHAQHRIIERIVCGAADRAGEASHFKKRRDSEEAGEAAAVDVVKASTKAEDVRPPDLAAVVLKLLVGLEGLLWCQKIGAGQLQAEVEEEQFSFRGRVIE